MSNHKGGSYLRGTVYGLIAAAVIGGNTKTALARNISPRIQTRPSSNLVITDPFHPQADMERLARKLGPREAQMLLRGTGIAKPRPEPEGYGELPEEPRIRMFYTPPSRKGRGVIEEDFYGSLREGLYPRQRAPVLPIKISEEAGRRELLAALNGHSYYLITQDDLKRTPRERKRDGFRIEPPLQRYRAYAVNQGSRKPGDSLKKARDSLGLAVEDGINIFACMLGHTPDRVEQLNRSGVPLLDYFGNIIGTAGMCYVDSVEALKHLVQAGTNLGRYPVYLIVGQTERTDGGLDLFLVFSELGSNIIEMEGITNLFDLEQAIADKGLDGVVIEGVGSGYVAWKGVEDIIDWFENGHKDGRGEAKPPGVPSKWPVPPINGGGAGGGMP